MEQKGKKKAKILVVDDDVALTGALVAKLEIEGFEATAASNGEEGIALALESKPDLILLDLVMPVMDGLTAASEIRQNPQIKSTPIIILTNQDDPAKLSEALEHHIFDYLVKSNVTLDEVVQSIKKRIGPIVGKD
jgi:CheY-like chemotaxis protein